MKKIIFIVIFISFISALLGCRTGVPSDIPDDISPQEIIQQAQELYEKGNNYASQYMYELLLDRYGTDTTYLVIGLYEIAHIKIKEKKYAEAESMLNQVLECYDSYDAAFIPAKYRVLAQKDLEKIEKAGKRK
ncbi:MAG: hypothetical protein J6Y75_02875 [Spirochaetaceae bacterium]|nr:hypothetical protein [Spirochaetaceae bacterium]